MYFIHIVYTCASYNFSSIPDYRVRAYSNHWTVFTKDTVCLCINSISEICPLSGVENESMHLYFRKQHGYPLTGNSGKHPLSCGR